MSKTVVWKIWKRREQSVMGCSSQLYNEMFIFHVNIGFLKLESSSLQIESLWVKKAEIVSREFHFCRRRTLGLFRRGGQVLTV